MREYGSHLDRRAASGAGSLPRQVIVGGPIGGGGQRKACEPVNYDLKSEISAWSAGNRRLTAGPFASNPILAGYHRPVFRRSRQRLQHRVNRAKLGVPMAHQADRRSSWVERTLPCRLVLTFHGVGIPVHTIDANEVPFWVDPALLFEAVTLAAHNNAIEITFDDGNASDYQIAYPALAEAGIVGTFFVIAGRIDQPGYLQRHEVAEMVRAGMTIGSHGHDHIDWTRASDQAMRRELHDARAIIEDCLGQPVHSVSIPFGAFDARVLRLISNAAYDRVHTSSGGLAARHGRLVPRNTVHQDWQMETEVRRRTAPPGQVESGLRNWLRGWKYGVSTWKEVAGP